MGYIFLEASKKRSSIRLMSKALMSEISHLTEHRAVTEGSFIVRKKGESSGRDSLNNVALNFKIVVFFCSFSTSFLSWGEMLLEKQMGRLRTCLFGCLCLASLSIHTLYHLMVFMFPACLDPISYCYTCIFDHSMRTSFAIPSCYRYTLRPVDKKV